MPQNAEKCTLSGNYSKNTKSKDAQPQKTKEISRLIYCYFKKKCNNQQNIYKIQPKNKKQKRK